MAFLQQTMIQQIGYCTNVHAGVGLDQTLANLRQYAVDVKNQHSPNDPMGIGLWLSAAAAEQLVQQNRTSEFTEWLRETGLVPFTLNGFPFGDFHQPVVKHRVYKPTWCERERFEYTTTLIDILHDILPAGLEGSISTLPIKWGSPPSSDEELKLAASHLRKVAEYAARLEQQTGRLIYLCVEPEPGCVLQRSEDLVQFFERFLFEEGDVDLVRRHIRICHDVCHAAVMFEDQREAIQSFADAGIEIGKVQVSSAVRVRFGKVEPEQRTNALRQLSGFAEDRYLHQTMIHDSPDVEPRFYEDLPAVIASIDNPASFTGELRTHFHVPVYLEQFGLLETTRDHIDQCLSAIAELSDVSHFEVETYAWGVLPAELQRENLADGIAEEMRWFTDRVSR